MHSRGEIPGLFGIYFILWLTVFLFNLLENSDVFLLFGGVCISLYLSRQQNYVSDLQLVK